MVASVRIPTIVCSETVCISMSCTDTVSYTHLDVYKRQNNSQSSTMWLRDRSFLRLKNAEIGYTVPKNWLNKTFIKSFRFYIAGTNLLTFSKFKLWDPELLDTTNGCLLYTSLIIKQKAYQQNFSIINDIIRIPSIKIDWRN